MAKVTGIGGVFFKSAGKGSDLSAWYRDNLGLELESWGGAILRWPDDKANDGGLTVWSSADHDTKWFSPSGSSFMINYRVDDLDEMLEQLKANGFANAAVYDPPGVGGTSVVTVLAHGDRPELYGLPKDPAVPAAVRFWKSPLKWIGNLAMIAGVAVASLHYLRFGPKHIDRKEPRE